MKRVAFGLVAVLAIFPAGAQSLDGFTIGEAAAPPMATRGKPVAEEPLGDERAQKWDLAPGLALSMTYSSKSGKVVFIEKDWDRSAKAAPSGVPGLSFGTTTLADIRAKFGSNGFGFRSNYAQKIDDGIAFANCFEIAGHPELVLTTITVIHKDRFEELRGDTAVSGKAVLETVILADRSYLRSLWGEEIRPDTNMRPVEWR